MWGEVVLSTCHILNRVPHKMLDKTPYEVWKGYSLNMSFLRVWGLAKVPLPDFKQENIGSKIFDYVFIVYAQNSVAYRSMSLHDFSISESKDTEFFEHVFALKNVSTFVHINLPIHENVHMSSSSSVVRDCIDEYKRSKRHKVQTSFGPDFLMNF